MPEGLKNAGYTFSRMIAIVLHPQLRRNILAYVDDIVVKSIQRKDHISDLTETFANLRATNLKLNHEKCVFGIHKGKVLGCLVSTKGIEANPDKIKALIEMQDPVSVKDVQKLTGRVATLNRFIPKFQELLVVRSSETSFPRTQRLSVKHDQAVPSKTKIATSVIFVCFKLSCKCCASTRERRRRKTQANPGILHFRSSLRIKTLLFRV
jgi:hypothetical protein